MAYKETLTDDDSNLINLKIENKNKVYYQECLFEEMNKLKKNMKSIEKIKLESSADIIRIIKCI